ncbi:MAG: ABC transporter permease [Candidatus Ornithobacterium hominis]|nr:ABC transporter permease [Candidatus Ornithobacterium hominis]MCT7903917.1 ABC transporter permease [Candidatus Ornithobacterium hominis]
MMKILERFFTFLGHYVQVMSDVFKRPKNWKVYKNLVVRELYDLGVNSVGLVAILSLFMGAVLALQLYQNFKGAAFPVPDSYVGYATKVIIVLEFSSTIICIILAGKVGSFIASSIGTMRVTEQIDALEVMGVNSATFLILPKIIAALIFWPILLMFSIISSILGGYLVGIFTGQWASVDFVEGLQMNFDTWFYTYSFIKMEVFAFIIATIPAYFGYTVKGGSLEVGRASTTAVVWTCIVLIISNLILTQMLL